MKRTCNGCKALEHLDFNHYACSLGYRQLIIRTGNKMFAEVRPDENCPKPKTNDELVYYFNKNKR